MDDTCAELQGLLVADLEGRIFCAVGCAASQEFRTLASDRRWLSETRGKRIRPVTIDGTDHIVLAAPLPGADALIVRSAPSNATIDFVTSVDFAYDIIEHMVTNPFEAMTVVDAEGRIVYVSPVHERFFGISLGEARGKPVRQVIENTRLDKVVKSGRAEIGDIQRMNGEGRVVSRVPIRRDGEVVGAVGRVMFKGPEQLQALSRRISDLESEVEFYRRAASTVERRSYGLDDILGESAAMRRLREEIIKVAPLEISVLISGESGTGKELVAQAIHRLSPRRDAHIVMVNAATLPETLVEAELFGYEPGAFTGADRKGRKGKFEQADEGTIFLDEIGDMPLEVQAKLLRVLQDRIVEPIGGNRPREVDFRLVTATNRDLQAQVAEGRFRLDLYYRISPIVIEVPPLRSRTADIPLLASHFLHRVADQNRRRPPEITDQALDYLQEQAWPGNVRQLRHEIERAFVFAENDRITADLFARYGDRPTETPAPPMRDLPTPRPQGTTMKEILAQAEREHIREALARYNGNKKKVAEELGISRSYLYKLLGEGVI
ncbi:sigma-54 interaction domain-containing protein [Lutibaculum baratangense]|uniref:Sigma54 specific transcriptional regulator, Fis family n=1 Tax=Lutibaculum baratangense AMV1 TaxID=631454 RepID=V4RKL3_9HYPH|nr:sigma 54-interacting transcriptional regulator [Lutibaculum baratangense]ESR23800.1 sigma54 specific transcriptional regulator, Fis family [Lutibaculum baratangense AMV1]